MANLNKVFLIGNLTKDPELRYTPSGTAVCDMRMAINRRYRTGDGQEHDETCFVNVTAWGRQAETSNEYMRRGSSVFVEGRLKWDEWEKDGQKHSRLDVVAERIQFLGAPRSKGEFNDTAQHQRPAQAPAPEAPSASAPPSPAQPGPGDDEENLPF